MESPKISIIVPVYKAEPYLRRCVDSLLAQTFTDFEILLVDDGSPDRSGEFCDEYAAKDSRIRVFHKENGGVSSARQCGVDNAKGEYTIHADSDDWVESTMLEELYNTAQKQDADMVICDYYQDIKGNSEYIKQQPSALDSETVLSELLFQQLHGSCCNKLVRRACYSKQNIQFPKNVNYSEDLVVCVELLLKPSKIAYCPMAFYHYCFNSDSITRYPTIKTYEARKNLYFKMEEILPEKWMTVLPRYALAAKMEGFRCNQMTKEEFNSFAPMGIGDILTSPYLSFSRKIILSISLLTSFKFGYSIYNSLRSIKHIFGKYRIGR